MNPCVCVYRKVFPHLRIRKANSDCLVKGLAGMATSSCTIFLKEYSSTGTNLLNSLERDGTLHRYQELRTQNAGRGQPPRKAGRRGHPLSLSPGLSPGLIFLSANHLAVFHLQSTRTSTQLQPLASLFQIPGRESGWST